MQALQETARRLDMGNRTYSIAEVAEELGISRGTAYQLAREGKIPVIRLGRRMLVPKDNFDKWLSDSISEGKSKVIGGED